EMRIIADHMRASIALAESGVIPSNKGQGYVMRRLIRRAVVKMRDLKGSLIVEDFRNIVGSKVILEEVSRFQKTLDIGLKDMDKYFRSFDEGRESYIPGNEESVAEKAFYFYQTNGIPPDIFLERLNEKFGFILAMGQFDIEEFNKKLDEHKEK